MMLVKYKLECMKTKKNKKWIAFYALPAMVFIVALFQIYLTQTTTLSRWKGGGFGMYTDINSGQNIIVVNQAIFNTNMMQNVDEDTKRKAKINLLYKPDDKSVKVFYDLLNNVTDTTTVQIYQPQLNAKTNTQNYNLIYEKVFIKN